MIRTLNRIFRIAPAAVIAALAGVAPSAVAQPAPAAQSQQASPGYPAQTIRIIVGYTPGTGNDIIARSVGQKLSERLGQPVVVENKPGASGNIGSELVARAKPDGHTLMVAPATFVMVPSLYKTLPFDTVKDFAPISMAANGQLMLCATPSAGIDSVAQLVRVAKESPGKLNYASPGIGTPHHLAMELFKNVSGASITHVPYKGTAGALTDLLGGQVGVMFVPIHVALPHVRTGKLKALAIGSPRRHPNAPDVPTLAEVGAPGVEVDIWYGFLAPAGTPRDIVTKLNSELKAILATTEIQQSFATQGLDAVTSTPEEFAALIERDIPRWGRVVREAKIPAE
jgi:tripartite-type tricarboxylate transporter receptor subunit TctC